MFIVQLLVMIIVGFLLLTPNQSAEYHAIADLIIVSSLLLLPVFVRNVWRDLLQKKPTTIFFILFLLAGAFSAINSIDKPASMTQLMLYVSYFIIFTSIRSTFPTLRSKELLVTCYLLLVIVLSAISLYNTLVLRYVNYQSEGTSFMWIYFGHNHLSALLLFAIPIAFYFLKIYWPTPRIRYLFLVTCFLLLVSLFLTLGRASMLSLFIASIIGLLLVKLTVKQRMAIALTIGILFTLFALPFGFGFVKNNFPAKAKVDIARQDINRPLYWRWAVKNLTFHPYFGTGLDTFGKVSKVSSFLEKSTALRSDHVHNFFLQMLSDAGIFGFLTSTILISSVLWQALRKFKVQSSPASPSEAGRAKLKVEERSFYLALFVGLFASTLNALVDYDWQLPSVFLIFWMMGGMLTSASQDVWPRREVED